MTCGTIVTIVNQTGRPCMFNLAPVSDNVVSLPPHGREKILEEELAAFEIVGAIAAHRLVVIHTAPAPAKTVADTQLPLLFDEPSSRQEDPIKATAEPVNSAMTPVDEPEMRPWSRKKRMKQ